MAKILLLDFTTTTPRARKRHVGVSSSQKITSLTFFVQFNVVVIPNEVSNSNIISTVQCNQPNIAAKMTKVIKWFVIAKNDSVALQSTCYVKPYVILFHCTNVCFV